jgi:glycosyltransferase involved in cell wall biosynthesis
VRILVVTQMWPSSAAPQLGIFVERQARALRALGADVHVASIPPAPGGLRSPLKWSRLIRVARRRAREVAPDIVLGHFLFPAGEAARQAAASVGAPYVLTCHGQDVTNAERSGLLRRITVRVLADAAGVIGVSGPLLDRLGAVSPLPSLTESIHMGVDLQVFRPADHEVCRHAVAAPADGPLVVQVGAKNVDVLAEAVSILRLRRPGAELWVVGGASPGPGPRGARMLGRLDPDAVARYLRAADCAAFVSLREGYGLGALEAVACGVPLVVSASLPVVGDLPAGSIEAVDPRDASAIAEALERCLGLPRDDPSSLAAVAGQGTDAMAARTLAFLERCVAARKPRPLP